MMSWPLWILMLISAFLPFLVIAIMGASAAFIADDDDDRS